MADPQKIITDPDFLAASPAMKRAILTKHDPDFAGASPEMQARIIERFSAASAPEPAMSPQELMARGISGSGFGTQPFATPQMRVAPAATAIRVAPGLVPNPLIAGPASAAGEGVAQAAEMGVGAREEFDPASIAIAGATPPGVATALRVARGLGRTATRTLPSLFVKAHEKAATGAQAVADDLTPAASAGTLFKAARGTGEAVPAGRITTILDDLDTVIDKDPTDLGLQQVRTIAEKLRGKIADGAITLDDLMRQRLDLGRVMQRRGSAPELRAIYGHGGENAKGIIGALEEAVEAGGVGAAAAREALTVFKRDAGVATWKSLVDQATKRVTINGSDTPVLNMAKLGNLVANQEKQLVAQFGDDGMAIVRAFQERFRALPPTQALSAANALIAGAWGGAGAIAGGAVGMPIEGVVAGMAGRELITNAWLVGKNPALLNQVMTGLAQATRAAVTPMVQPFNGPRVRQGLPPRG